MPHNQQTKLLFGADGKANSQARRTFVVQPLDVGHLKVSGLAQGEAVQIWHRVGSGNPLTAGNQGIDEDGVDFQWSPLFIGGMPCVLSAENNEVMLGLPGTFSIGDPANTPSFAGDVNVSYNDLDERYIELAGQIKSAAIRGPDGVVVSGAYDPTTGNLMLNTSTGDIVTIFVPGTADVLTSLSRSGTVLTYTDEEGNPSTIDLADLLDDTNLSRLVSGDLAGGTLTLTRDDGSTFDVDLSALVNVPETVTTLVDNGDGTVTYTSEDGTVTTSTAPVETLTSLTVAGNTLTYVDEAGNSADIDLSVYIDDTNLARIVNGTLDAATGIATFTRDDGSDFTLDLSSLLGDNYATADLTTTGPRSHSFNHTITCLLYTSPSPRDQRGSRMPSSA